MDARNVVNTQMQLNNDCLVHAAAFLGDQDARNMALAGKRWAAVLHGHMRRREMRYLKCEIDYKNSTLWKIKEVYRVIYGSYPVGERADEIRHAFNSSAVDLHIRLDELCVRGHKCLPLPSKPPTALSTRRVFSVTSRLATRPWFQDIGANF